jgi:hypothetical protein
MLLPQKRKICNRCNIMVGPHYFYARGPERGSHEGFFTLSFHMLHDPSGVCFMLDTSQTVFIQVGWQKHAAPQQQQP